ncbi:uncharacterized protein FIBRA_04619 [Fibroporia radiculosa]|uniref:Uncharacterized protein n=1 Tax=Fibroporia radiculosa TaxID=599839 RepID=J4HWM4_9APHY|nr:uncharacterized protein FIBRA_04619 [Fibroporia radiculosa]CCM02517.1 predicted protein [Fibroporia radiculosa]
MNVRLLVRSSEPPLRTYTDNYMCLAPLHPTSTPIARISDDILYEIFDTLVAMPGANEPRPLSRKALKEGRSWLAVTYVCRYWRNVALNSPRLWTSIMFNNDCGPNMLREFLKRSRKSALSVSIEGPSLQDLDPMVRYLAAMCAVATHRINSLYISRFSPVETNIILSPFKNAAPHLSTLVVSAEQKPADSRDMDMIQIFDDKMPSLRSIIISQLSLQWRPYENLTQILLMNQPTPSLVQLLWTLQKCPMLDSLGLGLTNSKFACDPRSVLLDTDPIHLPRLANLLLVAHHDVAAKILSRIAFPSTSTVVLALQHPPTERIILDNSIVSHVQSVSLDVYDHIGVQGLKFSTTAGGTVHVQWDWREGVDEFTLVTRLQHVGDLVRFVGVRQLVVRALDYELFTQDWIHILEHMPALERLELSAPFCGMPTLFNALKRTRTSVDGETGFILCPGLKEFIVSHDDVSQEDIAWAVECFESRRDYGARLKLLQLDFKRPLEEFNPALTSRLIEGDLADVVRTLDPSEETTALQQDAPCCGHGGICMRVGT